MSRKILFPAFLIFSLAFLVNSSHALQLAPAELEKVNWESRGLTAFNTSGSGRLDIAYIDGVERSIDLLVQKKEPSLTPSRAKDATPPLSLSRFSRQRITTDAPASCFLFGDFGSGKTELVYTAKKSGLVFLTRSSDSSNPDNSHWVETHRISDIDPLPYTNILWSGSLKMGEEPTLVALVKGRLLIIRHYKVVASYGTLFESSGFLMADDINSDGLTDLIYEYDSPNLIAYRLQTPDGRFDREEVLPYAAESEKNFGYRSGSFFFFGGNTSFVEERRLTPSPSKPAVSIYGAFSEGAQGTLLTLPGESAQSLLLADNKGAELALYRQNSSNNSSSSDSSWGSPVRFPSLKNVTQLLPLGNTSASTSASSSTSKDSTAAPTFVLLSSDEHTVALTRWSSDERRFIFPQLISLSGEPVCLAGVTDAKNTSRVFAITRVDRDFFLQEIFADASSSKPVKLEGLKRSPDFALAMNETWNDKDGVLLGVFQSHEAAVFYWLNSRGQLSTVEVPSALARSNFSGIEDSRISVGRIDVFNSTSDNKKLNKSEENQTENSSDALFVCQRGTLRIFRFDSKTGQLVLADQALPLSFDANLRFPVVFDSALWAFDSRSDRWLRFQRNSRGLWENTAQFEAPSSLPLQSVLVTPSGFLGIGRRAFYTLSPYQPGVTLSAVKRWESALKFDGYNWGSLEYFDADKKTPHAVLFNQNKRLLEVVGWKESPQSLLNFELYKKDVHYNGRTGDEVEPRELIVADVTGDGKPDLITLTHNKIIVYPQK